MIQVADVLMNNLIERTHYLPTLLLLHQGPSDLSVLHAAPGGLPRERSDGCRITPDVGSPQGQKKAVACHRTRPYRVSLALGALHDILETSDPGLNERRKRRGVRPCVTPATARSYALVELCVGLSTSHPSGGVLMLGHRKLDLRGSATARLRHIDLLRRSRSRREANQRKGSREHLHGILQGTHFRIDERGRKPHTSSDEFQPLPGLTHANARRDRATLGPTRATGRQAAEPRWCARRISGSWSRSPACRTCEGVAGSLRRIAADMAETETADVRVKLRLGGRQDSEARKHIYQDRETDRLENANVRRDCASVYTHGRWTSRRQHRTRRCDRSRRRSRLAHG